MIRDITIGQYYAADSIIHKLDPRVKLAGLKKQRCKEKILDTHPEVLYDIGGERHE